MSQKILGGNAFLYEQGTFVLICVSLNTLCGRHDSLLEEEGSPAHNCLGNLQGARPEQTKDFSGNSLVILRVLPCLSWMSMTLYANEKHA